MKNLVNSAFLSVSLLFLAVMGALTSFAQEGGAGGATQTSTTHVEKTTEAAPAMWYNAPWVWVAGGAVFLIIIIALVRGNSSSKTTTSETTVIKD
jgi:hypothetical protein